MLVTLTLIVAFIVLFYIFLIWNFDYWSKRNVVGPRPKPFVGNFPNAFSQKRHMAYDLDDIYRKYKNKEDFVGIFSFRSPQLLIVSPALCRRVYVDDFKHFHDNEASTMIDKKSDFILGNNPFVLTGDEWKEKRALLTPGLTANRIKTVYPVTNKVCRKMREYIEKQIKIPPKDGIDIKDLCLRFTSEVVSNCVLGVEAASFSENPTPILGMIKNLFENTKALVFYITIVSFIPTLKKIWKGRFVPKKVEIFFNDLVQNAVDLRKSDASQEDQIDFLNYMLDLKEKKGLTAKELTGNTMTFLLDGFETTASVISHCLLLLARYPETQERLRSEIIANIDENGIIEFDKLAELPYLDACIHALPLYSIMTDEDFYPDPQKFKPERFLEENGGSVKDFRDNGLYYGFADGPRVCIGMRFALQQSKAALIEILRNFKIRVNPKTREDNKLDPKYFLTRLDGGIFLDFEVLN